MGASLVSLWTMSLKRSASIDWIICLRWALVSLGGASAAAGVTLASMWLASGADPGLGQSDDGVPLDVVGGP